MNIAVLGGQGFIGSELVRRFKKNHQVFSIIRDNYNYVRSEFDILINANGNSKKFWAEQNPQQDYEASVTSVYNTFYDFKFKKYIYISSIDVYKPNIYGFHKELAEDIIKHYSDDYIILRCAAVIGKNMKKGVLHDIINEKELFVTSDSIFQFITNTEIANIIYKLIEDKRRNITLNVGSSNGMLVDDIAKKLGKKLSIRGDAKKQVYLEYVGELEDMYGLKSAQKYIEETIC